MLYTAGKSALEDMHSNVAINVGIVHFLHAIELVNMAADSVAPPPCQHKCQTRMGARRT